MQHDPLWSTVNLDLWPNFPNDLKRLTYSSFDASWQEEHDACTMNYVPFLIQQLSPKRKLRKNE